MYGGRGKGRKVTRNGELRRKMTQFATSMALRPLIFLYFPRYFLCFLDAFDPCYCSSFFFAFREKWLFLLLSPLLSRPRHGIKEQSACAPSRLRRQFLLEGDGGAAGIIMKERENGIRKCPRRRRKFTTREGGKETRRSYCTAKTQNERHHSASTSVIV